MRDRCFLPAVLAVITVFGAIHQAMAVDADASPPALSQYYGFLEPELFKLDQRVRNLRAADLNGDGLCDLVVIDNAHSRLDVLLARTQPPGDVTESPEAENEVGDDWRFRLVKVPVSREVTSLAVGDFNGDGRSDFAYVTAPSELVVALQDDEGNWSRIRRVAVADLPQTAGSVASGDLNGDQRDDIVLLGTNQTYVIYQTAEGELDEPFAVPNAGQKFSDPQVGDLDGDGRNDLLYVTGDDATRPVCVRFQDAAGRLGSEMRFELPASRALRMAEIDGSPGLELLAIENRTNRLKVFQFDSSPEADDNDDSSSPVGQLVWYGLGSEQSGRDRLLALGDLDGDGLDDVVVSDPSSAQLIVFRQSKGLGLGNGEMYPGLVGAKSLSVSDLDGDGRAEVVLASEQEKALGVCRLEEGRLTFPVALPAENVPVSAAVADLDGDGRPEIVYASRQGTSSSARYDLRALVRNDEGTWQQRTFGSGGPAAIPLALRGDPEGMLVFDANGDGRPDYLVFAGFNRPPLFLSTNAEGVPEVKETDAGFGMGGASRGGTFVGELEGPVLLVAQKSFARNLILDAEDRWQVRDQYNGPSSAKIAGVSVLDVDGDGVREIVLVEEGTDKLRFLKRQGQVYRPWKESDLGRFAFKAVLARDLNGDGADDLLLFGAAKFGVVYSRSTGRRLREIASFESTLKDVRFTDVLAGDLNHDGRADLALVDVAEQYLQIVAVGPDAVLVPALHFKVFESKSFGGELSGGNEPREGLVADVTGDGRGDVVLLVHDRVLVYPQDSGSETPAESK
jgi:hypothetical protein